MAIAVIPSTPEIGASRREPKWFDNEFREVSELTQERAPYIHSGEVRNHCVDGTSGRRGGGTHWLSVGLAYNPPVNAQH